MPKLVKARLQKLRGQSHGLNTDHLVDFVPKVSPHLESPHQLAPYAIELERAPGTSARIVFAAPPQHGKTVLTEHGLVRYSFTHPGRHYVYVTYNQDRADKVARDVQRIAESAGLEPRGTIREWSTRTGTHYKFTSIGGSLTGYPIDGVLIVDDPFKDRTEADSPRYRERAWDWMQEVGLTRLHPGASAFVMATRWHPDDVSGRCIADGWRYINLKAVSDGHDDPLGRPEGVELWPEKRPIDFLRPKMANVFTWHALYQGEPRPRGGKVFQAARFYDTSELPRLRFSVAHGVDLAYSSKTHADWSVCVTMIRFGDTFYVVDMARDQVDAPTFAEKLRTQLRQWPGTARWYAAGTESAAAQWLASSGVYVEAIKPPGDKLTRALPAADAWNAGRIVLPAGSEDSPPPGWVSVMRDEVEAFTGVDDPHDDIVDALAAAYDVLEGANETPWVPEAGGSRWDDFAGRGFG